ncbi:MAG: glutathione S-transferase [Betaproteobacteria bacterium]
MLVLCGFAFSNYYNKVKLALMEKLIPFEEELIWTGKPAFEAGSPLGKVPFLKTPQGIISESDVILEYLEQQYPDVPLIPRDHFQAAKVREINTYLNLHLELSARSIYPEAFFKRPVSEEVKASAQKNLKRFIPVLNELAAYTPYIAGDQFTIADCSAIVHFPWISLATKLIYGEDMLAATPAKEYSDRMKKMPSMIKINEDRKANQVLLMEKLAPKPA